MDSVFDTAKEWLLQHGIAILVIAIATWVALKILKLFVSRIEKHFAQKGAVPSEQEKRVKTLTGLLNATVTVLVSAIAVLMIVTECGLAIGPLLAGAGIAGVAIGFGAQTLVRDVINGFFLLIENQLRVDDVVTVAGISGLVEAINLRTTRLRDLEGRVHIIPNSSITVVTNFTREWSRALVDIGVAYKEDVDRVVALLRAVGEELQRDPELGPAILEPLTILGVDSFGDSSVNLRMFFKTVPLKQWDVAREFRRRVKRAFDEHNIEIPFPHRTLYLGEGDSTGLLRVQASVSGAGAEDSVRPGLPGGR